MIEVGKKKVWYKVCYFDKITRKIRGCEVISEKVLPDVINNMKSHANGIFVTKCTEEILDCDQFIGQEIETKIF